MRKLQLAVLTTLLSSQAIAQPQPGPHYGPGMMWDGWWFGMIIGPLTMIIFIAAVVVLVVVAIRWLSSSTHHGHELHPPLNKTPLDILKERFARGEIDKEEFEERRRLLKDD